MTAPCESGLALTALMKTTTPFPLLEKREDNPLPSRGVAVPKLRDTSLKGGEQICGNPAARQEPGLCPAADALHLLSPIKN